VITLREAALMALKALEFGHLPVADQAKHRDVMSYIEAMDVLRKALDADSMASLPEPVAWMLINAYGEADDISYEDPMGDLLEGWTCKPLYTAPPLSMTISGDCATSRSSNRREWQGLTDEEIWSDGSRMGLSEDGIRRFAREIEAKLKEKNA